MKKFIKKYIDFILFIVLLILISICSSGAFKRFDLTSQGAYSLSEASRTTLKTLTEPLSVNLFFSDKLPSPYNETYQYVKDIMSEYGAAGNKNFSYKFYDMSKPENEKIAQDYGLSQVQIQEAKTNEVGFKQVYMGLVIVYGSQIETINGIDRSEGFEYKLTTRISKIISNSDALASLGNSEKIKLSLYCSDALRSFRIGGMNQLDSYVQTTFDTVNKKNLDRLTYEKISPAEDEVQELSEKYGMTMVNWQNKDGTPGKGIFGMVMEFGDAFRVIPLGIQSTIFGNQITGLDKLETSLNEAIQSIFSKTTEIGFITGHGEMETTNPQTGADINLVSNFSDMYTLKTLTLTTEDIPGSMNTIVIAGSKSEFTDVELYKIDQFLMKGGNLMIFADSFEAEQTNPYMAPTFKPTNSNLSKILEKYGVKFGKNYVMDEKCYTAQTRQYGTVNLYYAPTVTRENLAGSNPIAKNLDFVIFVQAGSIDVTDAEKNSDLDVTVLAKSSDLSWTQYSDINLMPGGIRVPMDGVRKSENLAVLLEGKFNSAFDKDPSAKDEKTELASNTHLAKSTQPGKIFISSTTKIISDEMFDKDCSEPVAMFSRNAFDYMNGNADLCTMRTKNFTFSALKQHLTENEKKLQDFMKYFCQFGIPVLVVIAGLVVLFMRHVHRNKVHRQFNPDDKRDSFDDKKKKSADEKKE